MRNHKKYVTVVFTLTVLMFAACNQASEPKDSTDGNDSTNITKRERTNLVPSNDSMLAKDVIGPVIDQPKVLVYNFHVTNRCPSCIAIENATSKTLKTYFSEELKHKQITQFILNVDDKANANISEKYQAFGSGVYVTRIYKGKETTADLTGDGFKFAKNKEERFIEILKATLTEFLK